MATNTKKTHSAIRIALVAALLLSLSATGFYLYSDHQQKVAIEAQERHERILQAVDAAESDTQFWADAAQAARAEQAEEFATRLTRQRQETAEHVSSYADLAEQTAGEVADEDLHAELSVAIESLYAEAAKANTIRLDQILEEIDEAADLVEQSHQEWQAEQERLVREREEEERRRQEEERRQAEERAAQQAAEEAASQTNNSTSSVGSSGTNSNGDSGSDSGQPSSGSSASTSGEQGGSFRSRAEVIVAQHGCSSVPVIWDSPRLPAGANGAADWFNGTILLRSAMPEWRMPYVAAHECAHFLQWWAYDGDLSALESEMNAIYGGSGYAGLEQNADCVTARWGYSAWNYTRSCSGQRGQAAAAIASGNRP